MSPESPEDRCAREGCGHAALKHSLASGCMFMSAPDVECECACYALSPAPAPAESPWAECERLRRLVDEAQARSACHAKNAEQTLAECERLRTQLATIADEAAVAACEKARVELAAVREKLGRAVECLNQIRDVAFSAREFRTGRAPTPVHDFCEHFGCMASRMLARLVPSQLEPVDSHVFVPMGPPGPPPECRVCGNPDGPPWHKDSPTDALTSGNYSAPAGGEKAGIIKPPCEYCRDDGGKPECYECKKVMP